MTSKMEESGTVYLGDGLYASFDGYQIQLQAHNGEYATNTVWLDPSVLTALDKFQDSLRARGLLPPRQT